ncbi:Protein bola4 [Ranunculus cassubicifolius]
MLVMQTVRMTTMMMIGSRLLSTTTRARAASFAKMYTPPPPLVYVISKNSSSSRRSFSVSATHVNDSGSIDSPLMQSMHNKIKEQLNADLVVVKDAYGDGRHVSIDVVSSAFEGQSAVNRQRMVYKAIWEELQNTVHAVDQMTTKTPTEAAATH